VIAELFKLRLILEAIEPLPQRTEELVIVVGFSPSLKHLFAELRSETPLIANRVIAATRQRIIVLALF
jgi:hypothetical protein